MENLENKNPKEGETTKKIEDKTAQIPSKVYLCAAITAMVGAAALKCVGHKHTALFVGQWVAPFLLFGIYNKIVKTQGHDQQDHQS
ncbi:hypothetical protein MUK51_06155 [Sphingobacterium faecium]|jgi:hypothetical protein|uniref:hypothetical protein n=1 Tax=Sphingobacterium faecium TaxID=34087 RepID=UPI0004E5F94E|nr:hypothetical protein [Sphingobacterium faecium]PTX07533.1 hypothetical protein C8N37_11142 [Sphingobacterium faecium]UXD70872.1 hypothetical protein MUK51_06155 [Sphingobacterium faecium]UZJ64390.1 hypothetical protein OKW96_18745 [Sphingobacterium sp. KU25419]CDS97693.1 conserved hypothetical protein [Sphingobacterium sp. PM2-P1-29]